MKTGIILFLLILLCEKPLFAKTPVEEREEAEKAWSKASALLDSAISQEDSIRNSLKQQNRVIDQIQDRIRAEQRYLKENEKKYSKIRGGFLGFFENNSQNDFTQEYDRRKTELSGLEARRKMEEEKLENMHTRLETAVDNFDQKIEDLHTSGSKWDEAEQKLVIARNKVENELMDSTALMLEHQIVGQKIENVGLQMDRIKDKYDNAMIGVYLRDRIHKLLNSKAFCSKANSCAKNEAEAPNTRDDELNSIFQGYLPSDYKKNSPTAQGSSTTR